MIYMFRIYNIHYNNYSLLCSFYELSGCLEYIEKNHIDKSIVLIVSPNGRHISFTKTGDIVFGSCVK